MSGYVEIEIDGNKYEAEYVVSQGGVMTVFGHRGNEQTSVHGMNEQHLSKQLLRHLIRKGNIDPT